MAMQRNGGGGGGGGGGGMQSSPSSGHLDRSESLKRKHAASSTPASKTTMPTSLRGAF